MSPETPEPEKTSLWVKLGIPAVLALVVGMLGYNEYKTHEEIHSGCTEGKYKDGIAAIRDQAAPIIKVQKALSDGVNACCGNDGFEGECEAMLDGLKEVNKALINQKIERAPLIKK